MVLAGGTALGTIPDVFATVGNVTADLTATSVVAWRHKIRATGGHSVQRRTARRRTCPPPLGRAAMQQ
jgi:hypothetical protein